MYAALHSICTDKFTCSFLELQFRVNNDAFVFLKLGFVCCLCPVSVAGHVSIDCSLFMPVQYHVGSQVYDALDFASNLLDCTDMREQYMLAMILMLKLDNDHQILTEYCIIKCTLHIAITALRYGLWP